VYGHVGEHATPAKVVNTKIISDQEGFMVTIDPNKPILNPAQNDRAESRSRANSGRFDAIFQQAVDSTEPKQTRTESAPLLSDIRPAQFSPESLPSEKMIIDRVDRLIDTMGGYQQKLIDGDATLRDIHRLVQQMAVESESLGVTSNALEGQARLKTIVNQSLTLASMEITKFNSGYYNDG
jgi:hypothetical protein